MYLDKTFVIMNMNVYIDLTIYTTTTIYIYVNIHCDESSTVTKSFELRLI